MALLEASRLTKHFGGLAAVSQLNFEAKRFSGMTMQGEA
jgi:ABC-type branched-subunit amino acid transport system ATPase component